MAQVQDTATDETFVPASRAPKRRIEFIEQTLQLPPSDLAAIMQISEADLNQIRQGNADRLDGTLMDRIEAIARLAQRLDETFEPDGVPLWLQAPNRSLMGITPLQRLREGNLDAVDGAIDVIWGGVYV